MEKNKNKNSAQGEYRDDDDDAPWAPLSVFDQTAFCRTLVGEADDAALQCAALGLYTADADAQIERNGSVGSCARVVEVFLSE